MATKFELNPFTGKFDLVSDLENPLQYKGTIAVNSDFPTSALVKAGWYYKITADVTDDDSTKTNTGDSFEDGDDIVWNGTGWDVVGVAIWKRDSTTISPRNTGDNITTTGKGTFGDLEVDLSGGSSIEVDEVSVLGGLANIPELSLISSVGSFFGAIKNNLYIRGATSNPMLYFSNSDLTSSVTFQYYPISTEFSFSGASKYLFSNPLRVTTFTTAGFIKNDVNGLFSGGNSIDISADTNLAVSSPITLTDDTIGFDFSTNNTWTGTNEFQDDVTINLGSTECFKVFKTADVAGTCFPIDVVGGWKSNVPIQFLIGSSNTNNSLKIFGFGARSYKNDYPISLLVGTSSYSFGNYIHGLLWGANAAAAYTPTFHQFHISPDATSTANSQGIFDLRYRSSDSCNVVTFTSTSSGNTKLGFGGTPGSIFPEHYIKTNSEAWIDLNGATSGDLKIGDGSGDGTGTSYTKIKTNGQIEIFTRYADALTIGNGTDGIDYRVLFNGETNDGAFKWMEDEDYFEFEDDIYLSDGENLIFGTTTGTKIGTTASQKLGFYGSTPIIRPTALTSKLTQITHTGPTTPDYAIATPIDSSSGSNWGFGSQDEFETVMSVILNLQTRVDELQTKLQTLGLIA